MSRKTCRKRRKKIDNTTTLENQVDGALVTRNGSRQKKKRVYPKEALKKRRGGEAGGPLFRAKWSNVPSYTPNTGILGESTVS